MDEKSLISSFKPLSHLLLLGSGEDGAGLREGDEIDAIHVGDKRSRDLDTLVSLTVLKDAAESTLSGDKSAVKHVDVSLLGIVLLLGAKTDLKSTRLIVSAVRARHKLTEFLEAREPGLKIVLLGSSIVESTRDDVNK